MKNNQSRLSSLLPLIGEIVLTKGKRLCFLLSFMTQNRCACLSNLSIMSKTHMIESLLPIINDSSVSRQGCPFSSSSNAKRLYAKTMKRFFNIRT